MHHLTVKPAHRSTALYIAVFVTAYAGFLYQDHASDPDKATGRLISPIATTASVEQTESARNPARDTDKDQVFLNTPRQPVQHPGKSKPTERPVEIEKSFQHGDQQADTHRKRSDEDDDVYIGGYDSSRTGTDAVSRMIPAKREIDQDNLITAPDNPVVAYAQPLILNPATTRPLPRNVAYLAGGSTETLSAPVVSPEPQSAMPGAVTTDGTEFLPVGRTQEDLFKSNLKGPRVHTIDDYVKADFDCTNSEPGLSEHGKLIYSLKGC